MDTPARSNSSVSSNLGWSPFVKGDEAGFGLHPKICSYSAIILTIYFLGAKQRTPSSSQNQSQPKWKDTGPFPLSLNLYCSVSIFTRVLGSLLAIIKSSTYTAMYS